MEGGEEGGEEGGRWCVEGGKEDKWYESIIVFTSTNVVSIN